MSGNKTHEHQQRQLHEGQTSQDWRSDANHQEEQRATGRASDPSHTDAGHSDTAAGMSRRRTNQESDHNKHNHQAQTGHEPQQHKPAEQKS